MKALKDVHNILASWAKSEEMISRVYLFGSCTKGYYPDVGDIDVAVELINCGDENETFAEWCYLAPTYKKDLAAKLPIKLDLQWYGGPKATDKIHQFLMEKSELIYERKA